jgi:hypothetical protein
MSESVLNFHQIDALARQGVDLLLPKAELTITETPRNNAYVYPQATGGDHGLWQITVTIAADSHATLFVNPALSPPATLAALLTELSAACHGHFRGHAFPECPSHEHPALISTEAGRVILTCPQTGRSVSTLIPAQPEL